jgi:hypothetical protein
MIVNDLDHAFARHPGAVVDQGGHASGHRVALDILFAPALDHPRHIGRGEIIAIVPLHALAHVQRVLCRVFVRLPTFEQHAAEGPVGIVLDHIFQSARSDIRHLRPVICAGILVQPDLHLHSERAALLRVCRRPGW